MEPKCVITINVNPKFWLFGLKGRCIQICKVGRGGVGNLVKVQYMGTWMILKVMLPSLLLGLCNTQSFKHRFPLVANIKAVPILCPRITPLELLAHHFLLLQRNSL